MANKWILFLSVLSVSVCSQVARSEDRVALTEVKEMKKLLRYMASPEHQREGKSYDLYNMLKPRMICYRLGEITGQAIAVKVGLERVQEIKGDRFNEHELLKSASNFYDHVHDLQYYCNSHPDDPKYKPMVEDFEGHRDQLHRKLSALWSDLDQMEHLAKDTNS